MACTVLVSPLSEVELAGACMLVVWVCKWEQAAWNTWEVASYMEACNMEACNMAACTLAACNTWEVASYNMAGSRFQELEW